MFALEAAIIAFDKGERILILPLCASSSWMPSVSAFEQFSSGWLTITVASTLCATVNDLVTKTSSTLALQPLKRNSSGDTYHDIRKLCNDVFCRKETLPMRFVLFSMSTPRPATPNSVNFLPGVSFSTWNCGQGCCL